MPLSQTESIARQLLRHYLPKDRVVFNSRPEWLVNPETGHALELDILYPEIGFACEAQGSQHGRHIQGLQHSFADFEKQQRHDMRKINVCRDRGIALHRLTIFDLTEARFDPFIKTLLIGLDRYEQYRRTPKPTCLYAQAEKLSRQKFKPANGRKYRKPGLMPLLQRLFHSTKKHRSV